jgi:hypothetical protein
MKKDDLKTRSSRGERICRLLDISPEVLPRTPAVEILGRSLIKIRGGGPILLYTPSEIRIALPKNEYISLVGEGLCCSSYNRGVLGVEGVIDSVSFEKCEKGGRERG